MTAPTPGEVAVATDALRHEADVWDEQSSAMHLLARRVSARALGRLSSGPFQLIVGAYGDVVERVAQRCTDAASTMTRIGVTLRTVAAVYDTEDARAEHRLRQLF